MGKKFLELINQFDLGDFRLFEDVPDVPKYDIAVIEGTPITKEQFKRLKQIRAKSKFIITIGSCACLGGVQELKNYQDKKERMKYVYPIIKGIDNPDIQPIHDIIKVDLELHGCPINKEEFYNAIASLLAGRIPKTPQKPVCYECQLKENECLLQRGFPCIGPISLGGCGAPCPSAGFICDGCRGPLTEINLKNMEKALKGKGTPKEIEMVLERFGKKNELTSRSR